MRKIYPVGAALVLLCVLSGCSRAGGGSRNVLLVSIDTVRADRLGCYGDPYARTPTWDRLARTGVQFRTALAHTPLTLPSHATIMSGEYPFEHLLRDNAQRTLAPSGPVLAEALAATGRATAGFAGAVVLDAGSGIERGFDTWEWADREDQRERRASRVVESAVRWLGENGSKPFFLFVHCYDPHEPYDPAFPWPLVCHDDPYRGEIAAVDHALTRLVRAVELGGRLHDTLLLVLSDHGEEFGEHGATGHGFFVYEAAMHVPLVIRGAPRFEGPQIRSDLARLLDVLPTVLAAVGEDPGSARGRILQSRTATRDEEESYGESWWAALDYDASELRSLRHGDWKYIRAPREELYDLATDPAERVNLAGADPGRVEAMRDRLLALVGSDIDVPRGFAEAPELEPERIEQLRALGYVTGGSIDPRTRDLSELPDPKDLAAFPETLRRIEAAWGTQRWDDVLRLTEEVLAVMPHPAALNRRALALVALGRTEEGLAVYDEVLERSPDSAGLWNDYGLMLFQAHRLDDARRAFRHAVNLDEDYIGARVNLAAAALRTDRRQIAWNQVRAVLERNPNHPEALRMARDMEEIGAPPLLPPEEE